MYRIKIENNERLTLFKNKYYAEVLGISPEYVSKILTGTFAAKANIVKGIISIAYNIPLNDYNMNELLEKHFTKEK